MEILTGRPAITRQYDRSGSSFKDLVSDTEDLLNEVSSVQQIMDPLLPKTGRGSWPISNAMQFAQICAEVSIQAKERHANGSTVVDISIPPPSFKLVPLSSPRSPLSKTPKQVFF